MFLFVSGLYWQNTLFYSFKSNKISLMFCLGLSKLLNYCLMAVIWADHDHLSFIIFSVYLWKTVPYFNGVISLRSNVEHQHHQLFILEHLTSNICIVTFAFSFTDYLWIQIKCVLHASGDLFNVTRNKVDWMWFHPLVEANKLSTSAKGSNVGEKKVGKGSLAV